MSNDTYPLAALAVWHNEIIYDPVTPIAKFIPEEEDIEVDEPQGRWMCVSSDDDILILMSYTGMCVLPRRKWSRLTYESLHLRRR